MDLRRRQRVIGSIVDGKPSDASFTISNFGIEWVVREYAFVPAEHLAWLSEGKLISVEAFTGDAEAYLQRTDLSVIAPEGADAIGLASMDFMIMNFRKSKRVERR